jgi:hypothetical protein
VEHGFNTIIGKQILTSLIVLLNEGSGRCRQQVRGLLQTSSSNGGLSGSEFNNNLVAGWPSAWILTFIVPVVAPRLIINIVFNNPALLQHNSGSSGQ